MPPLNGLLPPQFLTQLLYDKLFEISRNIQADRRIEILGNLDFEIKGNIDKKKRRIAKMKGNKILIKLDAVSLPEDVLSYIIAHEITHIAYKRHTQRFWKVVGLIYPDYSKVQIQLARTARS